MINDPEQQPGDLANLEPLPEMPPEVEASQAPAGARGPKPGPSTPSAANLAARAQEKAPQLLKKASKVLVVGSILPWMPVVLEGSGAWINVGLKLVLLFACWLILHGLEAHYQGSAAVGFGTKPLAAGRKGMLGALNGLHVIGALLALGVLILEAMLLSDPKVIGESVALLLGGLTFVHLLNYERGGKFNPLFPLMFLGCALGGLAALVGAIDAGKWLSALGAVVVTLAGVLAVYTIAVAMMQAKKDGDIKKAAALESRKQARGAARGGAGRPAP